MRELLRKKYFWVIAIFVLIGLIVGIFFLIKGNSSSKTERQAKSEAQSLYNRVDKIFVLPSGEMPTIATVTDPEKLQNQTFFKKAKKGDKVLIFTNAREAILYDPAINKVVAVAPLNIDDKKVEAQNQGTTLNAVGF